MFYTIHPLVAYAPFDLLNGLIEMLVACLIWSNAFQIFRDRVVNGFIWPMVAVVATAWAGWNLISFPAQDHLFAYAGSVALVSGNLVWVAGAIIFLTNETNQGNQP